jgi:hypothetical protein
VKYKQESQPLALISSRQAPRLDAAAGTFFASPLSTPLFKKKARRVAGEGGESKMECH